MNTTAIHRPVRTDADQRERERILRNDVRAATYAGRAEAEADEIQGRFAAIEKATVIGTGVSDYPRLPETNWTHDPVPPEAPLGLSVEDHEPVGEVGEIAASSAKANSEVGDVSLATDSAALHPSLQSDVEPALANPDPNPTKPRGESDG
jgi:hypothetical protein